MLEKRKIGTGEAEISVWEAEHGLRRADIC